jgi:hypothetical protein
MNDFNAYKLIERRYSARLTGEAGILSGFIPDRPGRIQNS